MSSAAAATATMTGSASTAKGNSSAAGSTARDSPRSNCITGAVTASAPSIEASTRTLPSSFPAKYAVVRSGVAASSRPTPEDSSRAGTPRTT